MGKKAFFIALFGIMVQYYDHYLFGFLASIISRYFIPASDPTVQLLNTYFIMFIAVMAKPIGSIVLGRIGDVYGRSSALTLSLIGTSIGSLIISLIPGYQHIGIISALILLLARMCVMSCIAPGTDGVRIFIYEQIGKERQCLGNGLATAATCVGIFIASSSAWFFTLNIMPTYAWRFAFLLGSIMGLIAIVIRKFYDVDDTRFTKLEVNYDEFKDQPILMIVKNNLKLFFVILLVAGAIGSTNQFYVIFFGTYCFDILKIIEPSTMKFYTSIAIAIYMLCAIIGGVCADYFGRLKVALIAAVIVILLTLMMMINVAQGESSILLYFMTMACLPFLTMPTLAFLKQSLPVVIRYRVFSLGHSIGSICISAPTAVISTFLYHKTHITWLPFIYLLFAVIVITFGARTLCKDYDANKY
jgi:MFS transporter, MHS family, proline/betaine transporter